MAPVIEPLRPEPPRTARRAEQRGDRRRRRRRIIGAIVVVAVLAAVAIAVTRYRRHDGSGSAAPAAKPRTQQTMLLQIPGATGEAVASALFVTDSASANASLVLVPSRVLSQVPGYGSASFGEALKLGGPQLSQDTLANQLGIIVDSNWLVTQDQLAALVDAVGGVDVNVDVDLPGGSESSNVVLSQGQQHLSGQAAAAYAVYSVPDKPELGRLTRLQAVLVGVLDALPKTSAEISPLVPATPSGPPRATVADTLRRLAEAKAAEKLSYKVVPVTDIDNGSDEETTRIDADQLAALIGSDLAGSVPPNAFRPDNRVVVRNGVGTAGIGQTVTRRLNAAGFSVVQTGNAENFNYKTTQVLIFDSGDRAVSEGEAVAAALGLSADTVEVSDVEQSVADVIVTVGADYAPTGSTGSGSPGVGP
jgi:LCP family protein required for cell wall assembly